MSFRFFLLKHFLFPPERNFFRKISLISFITIFISSFLSFFVLATLNYFHSSLEESFIAQKFHLSLSLNPALNKKVPLIEKSLAEKYPVKNILHYSSFKGILYFNGDKIPLSLKAVPLDFFQALSISILKGNFNESIPSIVIGKSLASRYNLKIGQILTFYTLLDEGDSENNFIQINLKLTGFFQDNPDSDSLGLASYNQLQYFGINHQFLGILLKDKTVTLKAKAFLKKMIPGTEISDYLTDNENILYAFKWEKLLFTFLLILIIMISFVIIFMGFSVMITHLKPTLFIFRMLGVPHKTLMQLFFYKSFFTGILGSFLGFSFVIILFYHFFPFMNHLFQGFFLSSVPLFILTPWDISLILVVEFMALFLSLFYPALRLNKLELLQGYKND